MFLTKLQIKLFNKYNLAFILYSINGLIYFLFVLNNRLENSTIK